MDCKRRSFLGGLAALFTAPFLPKLSPVAEPATTIPVIVDVGWNAQSKAITRVITILKDGSIDAQAFSSTGHWVKPPNATCVDVVCVGRGGGGGTGTGKSLFHQPDGSIRAILGADCLNDQEVITIDEKATTFGQWLRLTNR